MVGKRPRGIAASGRAEQLKVYVANAGSNSISVIDPTTNRVETEIPIRYGREPEGIAVASTAPDRELLFVANYGSNTLSVIDAPSYQEREKIEVGRGPVFVVADPPVETLTGSRYLSFETINILNAYRKRFLNVYVANRDSNDVSVIRIDTVTGRSVEVVHLDVEWRPQSITIDYPKGKAYVASYDSDKLSVIDIIEVVKGNYGDAVSTINNVGFSIIDVVADPTFDRMYLLKEVPGEIMIIRPFSSGFNSLNAVMPPVMGTIPVGSTPRAFLFDPERRKLYVVNRGSDSISVIDKTTRREEKVIPVGRRPYEIVIFPK
jgi:YVTN family beta-propeller protein